MTDKQKHEIAKCEETIEGLQAMIKDIKAQCKHERKIDKKYCDYDRNCYEVSCADCGAILFDGNAFEYRKYLEEQDVAI